MVFSLPYMPPWRGISCPGLEVVTCWSTSHTCQCNGYDHWGRQVATKNEGMTKKRGKGREMKWAMLEVEEKLKDDGGVGEVQSQGMVEEKEG